MCTIVFALFLMSIQGVFLTSMLCYMGIFFFFFTFSWLIVFLLSIMFTFAPTL